MGSELTRRGLLGRTAAGVAVLSGLAGCTGTGVFGRGDGALTLPAPGAVGSDGDYWFHRLDTARVREFEPALTDYDEVTEMAAELRGLAGVDFADTDTITTFAGNAVVDGTFSTDDARAVLESNGLAETGTGTEAGASDAVYADAEETVAVGVGSDGLVFGTERGRVDAVEAVEAIAAAEAGDEPAYAADGDFAELREQLPDGTHVDGGTHGFSLLESHVATGTSITLGETDSVFDLTIVFEGKGDIDEDGASDLAAAVEGATDLEDIATNVDERTVHVAGSVDTDDVHPVSLTGRFSFW